MSNSIVSPTTSQVVYSKYGTSTVRYETVKLVKCECCHAEISNLLTDAALVWRRVEGEKSTHFTAFHITHAQPDCINNVLSPMAITCWLPLGDFFMHGKFVFQYFYLPRYDESGKQIDVDVQVSRQSLARIEFALILKKIADRKPKIVEPKRQTTGFGYVYLIQSPTGAYKIGRTANPTDRMKTFSVKLPFEVEYVCVIQTEDMLGLENQLHNQFAHLRINGEWFQLSPDDVEYIKGLVK